MNEIVATLLLITACLFIWRFVKSIKIEISVMVEIPELKATVLPAPIQIIEPEIVDPQYDKNGDPLQKEKDVPDPIDRLNELFHGIKEDMDA